MAVERIGTAIQPQWTRSDILQYIYRVGPIPIGAKLECAPNHMEI